MTSKTKHSSPPEFKRRYSLKERLLVGDESRTIRDDNLIAVRDAKLSTQTRVTLSLLMQLISDEAESSRKKREACNNPELWRESGLDINMLGHGLVVDIKDKLDKLKDDVRFRGRLETSLYNNFRDGNAGYEVCVLFTAVTETELEIMQQQNNRTNILELPAGPFRDNGIAGIIEVPTIDDVDYGQDFTSAFREAEWASKVIGRKVVPYRVAYRTDGVELAPVQLDNAGTEEANEFRKFMPGGKRSGSAKRVKVSKDNATMVAKLFKRAKLQGVASIAALGTASGISGGLIFGAGLSTLLAVMPYVVPVAMAGIYFGNKATRNFNKRNFIIDAHRQAVDGSGKPNLPAVADLMAEYDRQNPPLGSKEMAKLSVSGGVALPVAFFNPLVGGLVGAVMLASFFKGAKAARKENSSTFEVQSGKSKDSRLV